MQLADRDAALAALPMKGRYPLPPDVLQKMSGDAFEELAWKCISYLRDDADLAQCKDPSRVAQVMNTAITCMLLLRNYSARITDNDEWGRRNPAGAAPARVTWRRSWR